jgi:hypothetical protein
VENERIELSGQSPCKSNPLTPEHSPMFGDLYGNRTRLHSRRQRDVLSRILTSLGCDGRDRTYGVLRRRINSPLHYHSATSQLNSLLVGVKGIEPKMPYGTGLQPAHDPYVSIHPSKMNFVVEQVGRVALPLAGWKPVRSLRSYLHTQNQTFPNC